MLLVQPGDPVEHVERHIGDGLRVVGPGHRQSAHNQIGVARDANGTQTMLLSQRIEGAAERSVNPTISAKSTLTSSNRSAIGYSCRLSRSAISGGRTLRSSRSDRCMASSRWILKYPRTRVTIPATPQRLNTKSAV